MRENVRARVVRGVCKTHVIYHSALDWGNS